MKTYVIKYNRSNGKMGKRTVKARSNSEAKARVMKMINDGFYFYIAEIK